jgi:two-component system, chemotaxis family, chemotaxis protein CheY
MKRLLIVEDSEKFRKMVVGLLKGYYDEIYECVDGKDAASAYAKYRPDWVVMDVEMKGLDGLSATRSIKALYPEARVVVMTTMCDQLVQFEAFSAGAERFIQKENILELKQIVGKK